MATAQHPRLPGVPLAPRAVSRPLLASIAIFALVGVFVLSPEATAVEAASAFNSLRTPGQTGFVAGHRGDKTGAPENTLPALQPLLPRLHVAINNDYAADSDPIPAGAEIACFPPVSGG